MPEQKGRKSIEELLSTIRRNQDEMRVPDGMDLNSIFDRVVDVEKSYWVVRRLASQFVNVVIDKAHVADGLWERFRLERSLKDLEERINHAQDCLKCKQVMNLAVMAIGYINMIPRVVTREDGEKALKHLAEKNNMTEAEFREWMNKTSDRIIKEMNEADEPKTD